MVMALRDTICLKAMASRETLYLKYLYWSQDCGQVYVSRCSNICPNIHFPFWLKQNNISADQPTDDCSSLPGFQLSYGSSPPEVDNSKVLTKDTLMEFQHIVNTSIKGLQLSFNYKTTVRSIR